MITPTGHCEVWLDDERDPEAHGWSGARWFREAWLEKREDWSDIVMSLDHDLGLERMTGYDIIAWIEAQVHENGRCPPKSIDLHTQNTVGKERMRMARDSIYHRDDP